MQAHFYEKTASTQILAKKYLQTRTTKPAFFASKMQTQGYGKRDRVFYSPKGGLYLSVALPNFELDLNKIGLITINAGLSVLKVLRAEFNLDKLKLKWVNDLYLDHKKVAGILCEKVDCGLVVGIGINLKTTFDQELGQKAASLNVKDYDFCKLSTKLAQALKTAIENPNSNLVSEFVSHSYLANRQVTLKIGKEKITGQVLGINEQGELMLASNGRVQTFNSGEVIKVEF